MFTSKQKYVFSELHFLSTQSQNILGIKNAKTWMDTVTAHSLCQKKKYSV